MRSDLANAHRRAIQAASRNRQMFPRMPVWFWIISAYAIAIAIGLEYRP